MKKTLTVNLGGTVFHIDEDAYRLLDNYLSNLKHYFRKQEGAQEIVSDREYSGSRETVYADTEYEVIRHALSKELTRSITMVSSNSSFMSSN